MLTAEGSNRLCPNWMMQHFNVSIFRSFDFETLQVLGEVKDETGKGKSFASSQLFLDGSRVELEHKGSRVGNEVKISPQSFVISSNRIVFHFRSVQRKI